MYLDGVTQDAFISMLETYLGADYTDEQKDLIKAFGDGPTFCFADPGTGKTFTAIGGLLNAEMFKRIPGDNIYALSFTRMATGELSTRYTRAIQTLHAEKYVHFSTLHSLCRSVLMDNYRLLDMSKFKTSEPLSMERAFRIVSGSLEEWGETLAPNKIKGVVRAVKELNSALIFDRDTVESKMSFKECGVEFELFDKIRGLLFAQSVMSEDIAVNDILLYTVMLMQRHPEVSQAFKAKCKLMLVDEAQDLSLLQLRAISLMTDNPVFIGDMKQQIYAFNGACQEVVQEFFKLYPTATTKKLTQSFRCKNEIADFATKIIVHNKIGGEDYKGIGDGGVIKTANGLWEQGMNMPALAAQLHEEYVVNRNMFTREYMFLARSNISLIPVIEELFKQGLPVRVNKYTPAYQVPLIKELCELVQLAIVPKNIEYIMARGYLVPEFVGYTLYNHPYYKIFKQTGESIFEINYQFKNMEAGSKAMSALSEVSEAYAAGATADELFEILKPQFYKMYVTKNEWKLDNEPDYYFKSVAQLTRKPYAQFINDEVKKINSLKENGMRNRGIRCYTMHASKGLEADVVYIIDADSGIIPNTGKLNKMLKKNCAVDVARALREERSLCYVACTRAKEELYIIYNGREPAPILMGNNNEYAVYDKVYEAYSASGDDIKAFESFTERYVPNV